MIDDTTKKKPTAQKNADNGAFNHLDTSNLKPKN